ncbi:MAG: PAS domain S-box protein [Chloroflexi bacterium]|nr:PAS domain S-box protein [Chloroflexota bacterium]
MKIVTKTKKQLIEEVIALHRLVAELEGLEAEHNRAEEVSPSEKERLLALMEALAKVGIGVDIVGIDYKVLFQNEALKRRFGDLTGKLCYEGYMGLKKPCDFCPMIKAIGSKKSEQVELTGVDGRDYELLANPLVNLDGTVDKVVEVVVDITEHRRIEEILKGSEEKLHLMFESLAEGITVTDLDANIVQVNEAVVHMHGYNNERELIGQSILKLITDKDHARAMENLKKILVEGRCNGRTEYRLTRRDGSEFPAELSASVFKDISGKPIGFITIVTDITERKQAEETLRESEKRYHLLAENAADVIWTVDMNMQLTYISPSVARLLGYSVEEATAKKMEEVFTHASFEVAMKALAEELAIENMEQKELARSRTLELELNRKDSSTVPVEVKYSFLRAPDGRPVEILAIARDITERKRVEEQTKQLQKYLQLQVDRMPIGLIVWDTEFRVQSWNPAAERIFGFTAEEASRKHPHDLIVPKEAQPHVENIWRRLLKGDTTAHSINENTTKDNRTIICEWSNTPLKNDDGTVVGVLSMVQDITERKRAEEALKRAAEEWRATIDSITDLVSIHSSNFKLVRVNKAYADACKMKPKELIGKTCYEVLHGRKECMPDCPHRKTLETKKPVTAEIFEPRLGSYLEVTTSPIFNEKGDVVASVHVARDITDRKRIDEQLIITDRLASVGELASGIAHELNNPLTSVIGFSQLLLDKDIPDEIKEDVNIIFNEARRSAAVVKNLLTFARKHTPVKQPVNINSIIEKVLELRAYEQKVSNIQVNTRFAPDLPEVMGDYFQLQQVFLNITINAEYFMIEAHNRGTLTITTEKVGDIVRASFADDGPGIAPENLGHLFDPFFTTKEVGKGTGLGLSICHGIITEHGGRIYAESELGRGATFIMELPISDR